MILKKKVSDNDVIEEKVVTKDLIKRNKNNVLKIKGDDVAEEKVVNKNLMKRNKKNVLKEKVAYKDIVEKTAVNAEIKEF